MAGYKDAAKMLINRVIPRPTQQHTERALLAAQQYAAVVSLFRDSGGDAPLTPPSVGEAPAAHLRPEVVESPLVMLAASSTVKVKVCEAVGVIPLSAVMVIG